MENTPILFSTLGMLREKYSPFTLNIGNNMGKYRKIPKISPRGYIFQRPFLQGLILEGLILGGAYIWWEFYITKPIGLASSLKVNFKKICVTVSFLPCFTFYLGAISKHKPPGAYIGRGDLTEGFLRYDFGGLIFGVLRYSYICLNVGNVMGKYSHLILNNGNHMENIPILSSTLGILWENIPTLFSMLGKYSHIILNFGNSMGIYYQNIGNDMGKYSHVILNFGNIMG